MIQKRKLKSNLFMIGAINEQNLTSLRCLSDFMMRKIKLGQRRRLHCWFVSNYRAVVLTRHLYYLKSP